MTTTIEPLTATALVGDVIAKADTDADAPPHDQIVGIRQKRNRASVQSVRDRVFLNAFSERDE